MRGEGEKRKKERKKRSTHPIQNDAPAAAPAANGAHTGASDRGLPLGVAAYITASYAPNQSAVPGTSRQNVLWINEKKKN